MLPFICVYKELVKDGEEEDETVEDEGVKALHCWRNNTENQELKVIFLICLIPFVCYPGWLLRDLN